MSEPTTMDQDAKLRVKSALLEHLSAGVSSLSDQERSERRSGALDRDTSVEADDTSHSYEAGDLEGLFDRAAERARDRVARIDELDFGLRTDVAAGSLVGFDGDRYVVGAATGPFQCDGVSYEGIETDSPIYPHLEGLRVGDTFTFGGREHRIDFLA
jgi:hypothetical protein